MPAADFPASGVNLSDFLVLLVSALILTALALVYVDRYLRR